MIPRGGGDEITERYAGQVGDVFQAVIKFEGASGEGFWGEAGHALVHGDFQSPEVEGAIAEAGGGHGIGDEHELAERFDFKDEPEHIRVEVDGVADDFEADVVIEEA